MAVGYIRSESDMKFLILFILDVMAEPLSEEMLLEAVMTDECADYFTFAKALKELRADDFILLGEEGYDLTPKGKKNFDALGRVLPYSVRKNAEAAAAHAVAAAKRSACIRTETTPGESGSHFITHLALTDGEEEIFSVSLLTVKAEQGAEIEDNFARHAEAIYQRVLAALLDDYENKAKE